MTTIAYTVHSLQFLTLLSQINFLNRIISLPTSQLNGLASERRKRKSTKRNGTSEFEAVALQWKSCIEIYRVLQRLGMEWKEKKNLGGLGGLKARAAHAAMKGQGAAIERNPEYDGDGSVDLKAASSILLCGDTSESARCCCEFFCYV